MMVAEIWGNVVNILEVEVGLTVFCREMESVFCGIDLGIGVKGIRG